MFATTRAAAIVLCFLAVGACRKNPAAKSGATVDRGPVIDSHTLIAPLDEPIDTALKLFKRVGVVKFCNKVNAIHLPADVLHKLYYANAERLIFARKIAVPVVDPLDEPPTSSTATPRQ